MEVIATPIAGLFEVQLAPRVDDRGYFMRSYDEAIFAAHGLSTHWVQENQSLSLQRGTLRGNYAAASSLTFRLIPSSRQLPTPLWNSAPRQTN